MVEAGDSLASTTHAVPAAPPPPLDFPRHVSPVVRFGMRLRSIVCLGGVLTAGILSAAPARAQYTPRTVSDPATGESYHLEVSAGLWSPSLAGSIASESLGIAGTTIDLKDDLGVTDQRFKELHAVLRLAQKHKLRAQYIPISYEQTATPGRRLVFNGQAFAAGQPVSSNIDWKAFRFTYEYDVVSRDRWFAGLLLDAKYTNVAAELRNAATDEFSRARAPIPALGAIVRVYPFANISVTGELSGVTVPKSVSAKYNAHYVDLDVYGTLNLINNVGAQFGYRSFDVGYLADRDSGTLVLKGFYFGGVVRY